MKVFVSGATGVLGRRVVKRLMGSDHAVVGLSRSEANHEWLIRHGAEPRAGDLFDRENVYQITSDCEGILHLATAIPTRSRTSRKDWDTNDRIRRDGTRNLVEAAIGHKTRLYIQESITLIYGDQEGGWVDEGTPIPGRQPAILESEIDMEQIVSDAINQHDLPAIILRFGSFYSHDSAQTRGMLGLIRKGFFPIIGDGKDYWNLINVDDAAEAVIKAIDSYEAGLRQTFNVCDDEPVRYGEMVRFIAETLGARRPMRIPRFLAKFMLGSHVVEAIFSSMRCRNHLIKDVLGWAPRYPTFREGYRAEIDRWLQPGE